MQPADHLAELLDQVRRTLTRAAAPAANAASHAAGIAGANATSTADELAREFMTRFELVPRQEYDRHITLLRELQARVEQLEKALKTLESA